MDNQSEVSEIQKEIFYSILPCLRDAGVLTTTYPERIYHYTSSAGLNGIINSGCIWATHFKYFKDDGELSHSLKILSPYIWSIAQYENNLIIRQLIEAAYKSVYSSLHIENKLDMYISCFSTSRDTQYPWQEYGDNYSGYCIGINPSPLFQIQPEEDERKYILKVPAGLCFFLKVHYNISTYIYSTKNVIDHFFELNKVYLSNPMSDDIHRILQAAVMMIILIMGSLYKRSEKYSKEKEWRFFINDNGNFFDVKLREENIPYIHFDFCMEQQIPIKEIIIGPKVDFKTKKLEVENLLRSKNYGFGGIAIVRSEAKPPN